jgi:hypothetical protein
MRLHSGPVRQRADSIGRHETCAGRQPKGTTPSRFPLSGCDQPRFGMSKPNTPPVFRCGRRGNPFASARVKRIPCSDANLGRQHRSSGEADGR